MGKFVKLSRMRLSIWLVMLCMWPDWCDIHWSAEKLSVVRATLGYFYLEALGDRAEDFLIKLKEIRDGLERKK